VTAQFEKLLPALVNGGLEFILIGGLAGIVHGSARATYDVDLVYSRTNENVQRLAQILANYKPSLCDVSRNLPFVWDGTIRNRLNFTLTTELGDLDLFGEVAGGGSYDDPISHSFEVEAFGVSFKCVDLPTLIRIKEAAGRTKDYEAVAELRALFDEAREDRGVRTDHG
jgi:predicted nucleotidyltransferase